MKFNDPELIPDHCLSVAAFDRRTADRYARDPTLFDPKKLTPAPNTKRRHAPKRIEV